MNVEEPKVFISYSWSKQKTQDDVIELATRLMHDGVDVVLDKWDLKEGQDNILDGRLEHSLLLEFFTDKGIGTAIIGEGEEKYYVNQ